MFTPTVPTNPKSSNPANGLVVEGCNIRRIFDTMVKDRAGFITRPPDRPESCEVAEDLWDYAGGGGGGGGL